MATSKRPAGAMVIAVLNLLFGLPCLCCAGFSSGGSLISAMDKGNAQNEFKIDEKEAANNPILKEFKKGIEEGDFLAKEVPHMNIANFVMYAIGTIAGLLLFTSGILLIMMRNSGRLFCIAGAILLLVNSGADMIYSAVFVYPAAKKFDEKQRREGKEVAQDASFALLAPGAFVVLGGAYALLAIAVMLSGATRDAFAAASRSRDEDSFDRPPDDFDDRPPNDFR